MQSHTYPPDTLDAIRQDVSDVVNGLNQLVHTLTRRHEHCPAIERESYRNLARAARELHGRLTDAHSRLCGHRGHVLPEHHTRDPRLKEAHGRHVSGNTSFLDEGDVLSPEKTSPVEAESPVLDPTVPFTDQEL